jgi:hypothetical protein
MMPISVRDNSTAIQMGYNRANETVNRFNQGLNDASKGFEKGMIISRLKSEEDDYMKRQRLEKAIADNDTAQIQELLQDPWYKKLWSAIKGEGWNSQIDKDLNALDEENRNTLQNFHSQKMEGYVPAQTQSVVDNHNVTMTSMPEKFNADGWDENGQIVLPEKIGEIPFERLDGSLGAIRGGSRGVINRLMPETIAEPELRDRNAFLKEQGQNVVDNVPDATVARAAETAGINTGYVPASQQDQMNLAKQERDFESYVKDYTQATIRRNGIASTLAQYEALAANSPLSPEQQTIVKDLRHQYNSLNDTIRNIKSEGIKAGVPERRFLIEADGAPNAASEAVPESDRIAWTNEATQAGLPNNKKMSEAEVQSFLQSKGIEVNDPKIKHITQKQNENYAAWDSNVKDAQSRQSGSINVQKAAQDFAGANATNESKLNSLQSIRSGSNLDKANYLKMAVDNPALRISGVDVMGIADLFTGGRISEQSANKQEKVLNAKLDEMIAGLKAQTGNNGRGRM